MANVELDDALLCATTGILISVALERILGGIAIDNGNGRSQKVDPITSVLNVAVVVGPGVVIAKWLLLMVVPVVPPPVVPVVPPPVR